MKLDFSSNCFCMKRLFVAFVALVLSVSVKGQVVMDFSMFEKNRNVEVKFELKDSQSEEPIPWASAYLVPVGDTVITSFALSDDKGKVNLKDVPVGKYPLDVELIGYKPYKKVHDCTSWNVNLGVIKMEENPEMIDAASISAVGNPIEVLQDTIIYNASSFKVGENDMLEELELPENLIETDSNTVGGWVMELFGRIPETGATETSGIFTITVLESDEQSVSKVGIKIDMPKEASEE